MNGLLLYKDEDKFSTRNSVDELMNLYYGNSSREAIRVS
jgi:hypothetical protein